MFLELINFQVRGLVPYWGPRSKVSRFLLEVLLFRPSPFEELFSLRYHWSRGLLYLSFASQGGPSKILSQLAEVFRKMVLYMPQSFICFTLPSSRKEDPWSLYPRDGPVILMFRGPGLYLIFSTRWTCTFLCSVRLIYQTWILVWAHVVPWCLSLLSSFPLKCSLSK